jgi:hypothetical protein
MDKAHFTIREEDREYKIRAVCIVLICHEAVMMIKDNGTELEFPGGKVESCDTNIYDTAGRELWEELFLRGQHDGSHLSNWHEIKKEIVNTKCNHQCTLWISIMEKLIKSSRRNFNKNGPELKTLYLTATISKNTAKFLQKNCGAYAVDIRSLNDARSIAGFCSHNVVEIPVCGEYMKVRGRELFCIPDTVLV